MASRKNVKTRSYSSQQRMVGAQKTQRAILDAARFLFQRNGYVAVTVSDIAKRAGVSIDTIYASVGKKVDVFRLLLETAISGSDSAVEAEERDYVRAVRAAPTARAKLEIYTDAICGILPRLAPLYFVLAHAAHVDEQLAAQWKDISDRRARNMRHFAQDLRTTGELRSDLSDDEVADIIWTMNSTEYYTMLVTGRKWPLARFRSWLYDAWCRLLLAEGGAP